MPQSAALLLHDVVEIGCGNALARLAGLPIGASLQRHGWRAMRLSQVVAVTW